ncbi:MAG: PEGA domain-containing protein [Deltaproteobacteria bacterium]|nr:PEGA domain-containing protein [Deltaproteobacteria bacterium]
MARVRLGILLLFIAFIDFGCSVAVLKQDIPVSTNPLGSTIYADGQMMGQTPGMVSLERNRDHLLTLVKDDYHQVDVPIRRQYQSEKVLMKAVQTGVNSALFFKNTGMGINSGFNAISNQEESGEAYILVPSVVQVSLTPLQGPTGDAPNASTDGQIMEGVSPRASGGDPGALPAATGPAAKDVVKAGVIAGAAAMATQANPMQKTWETSSSSKSYVETDGTRITEKSGTSVGVSVNPAGLLQILDVLFK